MYLNSNNWDWPSGDQPVAIVLRQFVEPLLLQYNVTVAFWGHHHSYQRSCSVAKMACVQSGGIVHILSGAAGAGFSQNIYNPYPPYTLFLNDNEHGYVRGRVRGKQLVLEFVVGADRQLRDTITFNA